MAAIVAALLIRHSEEIAIYFTYRLIYESVALASDWAAQIVCVYDRKTFDQIDFVRGIH